MDTKKKQRYEAGEPVVEEDILAETLGRKPGYRTGMGYGFLPLQPTKRVHIHNSEAMKNAREQLQEQQSQLVRQQTHLVRQQTQIESQQITIEQQSARIEEQIVMIDTLHSELGTVKEKQIKLEANMDYGEDVSYICTCLRLCTSYGHDSAREIQATAKV